MLKNVNCSHVCTASLDPSQSDFLSSRIRDSYALNWLVDGLPAAELKKDDVNGEFYSMGFALGKAEPILPIVKDSLADKDWRVEVNNHYNILLEYHSPDGIHQRVVGVVVWPTRYAISARGREIITHTLTFLQYRLSGRRGLSAQLRHR